MDKQTAHRLTLIALNDWKAKAQSAGADVEKRKTLDGFGVLKSSMPGRVKVVDEAERIIEFVISTNAVDRDNDTLDVAGWNIQNYIRNPVVLFAHDHYQPVVGRSLATWIEADQLRSRAQFTPRELNPLGFMLFQLYANDYMRATSVGFMPEEWKFVEDRKFGVDFLKQELLEYSAVPVPSNPEALAIARSKGIDTSPFTRYADHTLDLIKTNDPRDAELKRHIELLRAMSDGTGRKLILSLGDVKLPAAEKFTAHASHTVKDGQCSACLVLDSQGAFADPCDKAAAPAKDDKAGAPAGAGAKAGRVLSKRNEDKLRSAHDAIGEVLAQLEELEDEDEDGKAAKATAAKAAKALADAAAAAAGAKSDDDADEDADAEDDEDEDAKDDDADDEADDDAKAGKTAATKPAKAADAEHVLVLDDDAGGKPKAKAPVAKTPAPKAGAASVLDGIDADTIRKSVADAVRTSMTQFTGRL